MTLGQPAPLSEIAAALDKRVKHAKCWSIVFAVVSQLLLGLAFILASTGALLSVRAEESVIWCGLKASTVLFLISAVVVFLRSCARLPALEASNAERAARLGLMLRWAQYGGKTAETILHSWNTIELDVEKAFRTRAAGEDIQVLAELNNKLSKPGE